MYRNLISSFSFALLLSACGSGSESNENLTLKIAEIDSDIVKSQQLELYATTTAPEGTDTRLQWQQTAGPTLIDSTVSGNSLVVDIPKADSASPTHFEFNVTATYDEKKQITKTVEFSARNAMAINEAARLLQQGSMGATLSEINLAKGMSEEQWLDQQMALPISYHGNYLSKSEGEDEYRYINRIDTWWKATLQSEDQLRQRVAFALSEILVVSDANNSLRSQPEGMVHYYDLLLEHAFGNYRDLLEQVTLSPVMGTYLSHLGNEKADESLNIRPDENYAREVMQLFTIGLEELNLDGSAKLNAKGDTIPTYGQEQIEGFARVFTGWTFADSQKWGQKTYNYTDPMQAFSEYHSDEQKVLLNNDVIPRGYGPKESLNIALDNLFNHQNVGPFISKQLIQRLITSNPTSQYIQRVATIFNDNGQGVRGDLAAVVKAIYLDDEARHYNGVLNYSGKLKEPLLKTVQLWRTLEAKSVEGNYHTWNMYNQYGQGPLQSPSVFNFFRPDYQPAFLHDENLYAPELEIASDANLIATMNAHYSDLVWRSTDGDDELNSSSIYLYIKDDIQYLEQHGIEALLERYNILYFAGSMSEATKQALLEVNDYYKPEQLKNRVAYVLYVIAISPEFSLQY